MLPRPPKSKSPASSLSSAYYVAIPCLLALVAAYAYFTGDGGRAHAGLNFPDKTAAASAPASTAVAVAMSSRGDDGTSAEAGKEGGRISYVKVDSGRDDVVRYAAVDEGRNSVTVSRYMEMLSQDSAQSRRMASGLSNIIRDCPYRGLFFETMGVSKRTAGFERFQFALVDSPSLARFAESDPDRGAFAEHLDCTPQDAGCCSFDNLGRDARLIAPRMLDSEQPDEVVYSHLAAFVRGAGPDQIAELWRTSAKEFLNALNERDGRNVWFSTSGMGIAWLHVRLDSFPKYYQYRPFAQGSKQ